MSKCTVQGHEAHSRRSATITTIHLQKLFILPNRNPVPMKHSLPSPPPAPDPHRLLSVSMDLTPAGTSCGWNQTGFVLLCLDYFTEHHVLKVHPGCSLCQDILPVKADIHLWMDHILCIYPLTLRRALGLPLSLGCCEHGV